MNIRPVQPADRDAWLAMRRSLWPGHPVQQLIEEIAPFESSRTIWGLPSQVFIAEAGDRSLCGFVEVSLRPFARGCGSSPVGYVEGWYVEPEYRRKGIGKALISAAEQWAREQGCALIASDCDAVNVISFAAHQRLGFEPAMEHAHFRKRLDAPDRDAIADWIAIVPYELDTAAAVEMVSDSRAGGIDVFLGTTRFEQSATRDELLALDYEAYEQMALEQMRQLAARAREKWPILKLAPLHRVGRVEVGRPSVVIAVSTPHRADAFAACRFLIDELKRDVAIWKKEVWNSGSSSWAHP